ncbi:MAG: hypothetical protein WD689_08065 [Gaiellaceae bacterium]
MAQSKRQTTHAKRAREQAVKEKRVRKVERKEERKLAAAEGRILEDGTIVPREEHHEPAEPGEDERQPE